MAEPVLKRPGYPATAPDIVRPVGVTILVILEFLKVLQGSVFWLGGWGSSIDTSFILLLLGCIRLTVGTGLWTLKKWAYQAAVILTLLSILIFAMDFVSHEITAAFFSHEIAAAFFWEYLFFWLSFGFTYSIGTLTMILIGFHAIILYYLTRPHIRKVFGITSFLR